MKWVILDMVRPVAMRVGGQVAAVAAALGMAAEHEHALAAAVAWGVVTFAESMVSAKSRANLKAKAKAAWGQV